MQVKFKGYKKSKIIKMIIKWQQEAEIILQWRCPGRRLEGRYEYYDKVLSACTGAVG